MLKKLVILFVAFEILSLNAYAYYEDYSLQSDDISFESVENGETFCNPKKSFMSKLKSAFVGQPTGFTPQIQPSPYLNPNFGPSYMQGYYSGNTWNSHNVYNPNYSTKLFGTSF